MSESVYSDMFNSLKSTHFLWTRVSDVVFLLCSSCRSAFARDADGTILRQRLFDLLSKINRTFLSEDKCTRTCNGAIGIAEPVWEQPLTRPLVDLLLSVCYDIPHASIAAGPKKNVILLLLARLVGIKYETLQEIRFLLSDLFMHCFCMQSSFRR